MAKEIGFLGHLEFFLLSDDGARWKAIGWIIFVCGIGGTVDLVLADSTVDDAVFLMGALALIISIGWIAWYCSLRPYRDAEPSPSRRSLILRAAFSVTGLFVGLSLSKVQARALESDLQHAIDHGDYGKAIQVLERATTASVRLNQTLVKRASQRLVDTAKQPQAWDAVVASLNYHSSYASGSITNPVPGTPVAATNYTFPASNVLQRGRIGQFGVSTAPSIPQLRALDAANPNENVKIGPRLLVWVGGSLILDGLYLKQMLFLNAHIVYRGGPIEMDDVWFVQCTFDVQEGVRGREFARAILLSSTPSVTAKID